MTTATPTLRHPNSGVEQAVAHLDSTWTQTRGAIGRGVGSGLWFDFDSSGLRTMHMVGVTSPLVAVFIDAGQVSEVARLEPWTGLGTATATDVVELPPECPVVEEIQPGDEVVLA